MAKRIALGAILLLALTVMANGVLVSNATAAGKTTWVWSETDPMAPYLSTATLGRFDLTISKVGNIPSYVAIDPTLPTGNVFRKLPEIVEFYESIHWPYPFNAVGSIADDAKVVGYSLETQTKPVYDRPEILRQPLQHARAGHGVLDAAARPARLARLPLPDPAQVGRGEPLRQRDDGRVHRALRAGFRPAAGRVLQHLALPAGEADVVVATVSSRR